MHILQVYHHWLLSYYLTIPEHCHLVDFVSYVPYNDIIFNQLALGIHFTSVKICT